MKNKRVWLLLLIFGGGLIAVFSQCFTPEDPPDARGQAYAGSKKCMKCHQDVYRSYLATAHYHSSQRATESTVHGSFTDGDNLVAFGDGGATMGMNKRAGGMYQTASRNAKTYRSERFDIVFGGNKAESYLYWKGAKAYELPISYYRSLRGWANSPGYDTRLPYFEREVSQRCFECHASYLSQLPVSSTLQNRNAGFDTTTMIYGIDCERCHGPAANHVNFHLANPDEKTAHYIKTYKSLSRKQRLRTAQCVMEAIRTSGRHLHLTLNQARNWPALNCHIFYPNNRVLRTLMCTATRMGCLAPVNAL